MQMNKNAIQRSLPLVTVTLITVLLSTITPLKAESDIALTSGPIVQFQPPDDDNVDDSRGGASRPIQSKCLEDSSYPVSMTALLPASNTGLTLEAHPTLFVYIPATQKATQLYFALRDEAGKGLYQTWIPLSQTAGIVSINLPDSAPALEVGQTYHWSVGLGCQPAQTDMPSVTGSIHRIASTDPLADGAIEEPSLQQAAAYARAGIWYDTLDRLVQLRTAQPDNASLATEWTHLLSSVGLTEIATQPIWDE
jgi:Domain of Unknown Function (DUF928)